MTHPVSDAAILPEPQGAPSERHPSKRTALPGFFARLRWVVLPLMGLTLALYVALHSPVRGVIAGIFGQGARGCYFACLGVPYASYPTAAPPFVSAGVGAGVDPGRLADALSAWVAIAVALLAAWLVCARFTRRGIPREGLPSTGDPASAAGDIAPYERPMIFGLAALAFLVVPAAALGALGAWASMPVLRPPLGPLLIALPAGGALALGWRRGWKEEIRLATARLKRPRRSPLLGLLLGLATALLLVSATISLTHPANGGDALSYHGPLAAFLWRDGNLGAFLDRAPGTWALAHPGTAELWFGLLNIAGGEPLADLGQLPFALLGAAAAAAFTRRLGLGGGSALISGFAFLFVPIVVMQIGQQPNDVVGAALLMVTIALASAPTTATLHGWGYKRLGALGLGLGFVAVTKLALLPCVVAVGIFVVCTAASSFRRHRRIALRHVSLVALMFFVAVAPWWGRNIVRYGNPIFPAALPVLGRGVEISALGRIDSEFVPSPLAWPLYPLLEPLDDRTGFGPLFILGLIPGLMAAALRARRRPLILYLLVWLITLPAWWVYTLHEPRFLLALFGLGMAFLPWTLLATPRVHRRSAAVLVALTALFSVAVTADQALLPTARQPTLRTEFYDRVWGVDPTVVSLPESEGILFNTGYAPTIPEYAAFYPLLGPGLTRLVLPIDSDGTTDVIIERMRRAGVRYAYVVAAPQWRALVESIYPPSSFELVHISVTEAGEMSGARRYLYRPVTGADQSLGTWRYLFRLKEIAAP